MSFNDLAQLVTHVWLNTVLLFVTLVCMIAGRVFGMNLQEMDRSNQTTYFLHDSFIWKHLITLSERVSCFTKTTSWYTRTCIGYCIQYKPTYIVYTWSTYKQCTASRCHRHIIVRTNIVNSQCIQDGRCMYMNVQYINIHSLYQYMKVRVYRI